MFATFVTRSGIIQSVHAFGRSPIGYYFLAFIALCLVLLASLMSLRRRLLSTAYESQVLLSRETSLLLTNLVLVGAAAVVLLGTLFPALVELLQGQQAALDIAFYERTVGPLLLATIALIGVCPWLAWGKTTTRLREVLLPSAVIALVVGVVLFVLGIRQFAAVLTFFVCVFVGVSLLIVFYRGTVARKRRTGESIPVAFLRSMFVQRRRYGAHIVHLGVVLMALGVTGSSIYQDEVQVALSSGEAVDAHGYTVEYRDFVAEELPDRQQFVAVVDVRRGNRLLGTLRPEKSFFWNVEQWVTEVAIHSTVQEDLYVILAGFESDGLASFRILTNPLVLWLWVGAVALMLGGALAWWPQADGERPADEDAKEGAGR
jgi:cytochrome c-type biogenesis protein CcmF